MTPDAAQSNDLPRPETVPGWVPVPVRDYIDHTVSGRSIRAVARDRGVHASTVLRHVRRLENRRDDILVDQGLDLIERHLHRMCAHSSMKTCSENKETCHMSMSPAHRSPVSESVLNREGLRILRRLVESHAALIIAPGLEKAAVVRETQPGHPVRVAVLERQVAQAMALKDWISCFRKGRVMQYEITQAGRAALKRLLSAQSKPDGENGFAEAPEPFRAQHGDWEMRDFAEAGSTRPRKLRYNLGESPLTALGRRVGKDGKPFLSGDLVAAGERLREDFELAQMGPRITQNWDRFLTSGRGGDFGSGDTGEGSRAARARVADALRDLGPGLGDIALRCCCFLEGLETAEKRMGWSARSGKVVLRIALQRLLRHYEDLHGPMSPRIG